MTRKNGYRLTTANTRSAPLDRSEYKGQKMEDIATKLLNNDIVDQNRKRRK